MNEQIKKLAIQAGLYVDLNGEPWPKWLGAEECEVAYQKFAELIITNIINIIDNPKNYNRCTYTTFDLDKGKCVSIELTKTINEHFGTKQ
jgi:hypothetical protein